MNKTKTETFLFYFILLLAAFTRLYKLGEIPLGLDPDEALSGYEAFSLLTTGHDSWGYKYPLYFIFWSKGTSVLHAYLTMPLMYLFGVNATAIRLPHAILGILSCYVFYRLLRLMFSRPVSLFGFFLAAIIPWQILLTRKGLEINIVPFFVLAGFYFFAKSIKNKDYLLLSAVFYGLGLYAYGAVWIYTALTFGFELLYILWYKRDKSTLLTVLTSGLIFTLFAFPIILLILINNNFIPEIRTDYFSIPKLLEWRSHEFNFLLGTNLKRTLYLIFIGYDNHFAFAPYGIFYPISVPFILIGAYFLYKKAQKNLKTSEFSISLCVLVNITIGFIYGLTFETGINRINFLWFFYLICIVTGLSLLITKPHWQKFIVSIYLIFFMSFYHTVLTKYNSDVAWCFTPNLKPALEIAEQAHQETSLPIKIMEMYWIHPKVLLYTKTPTDKYLATVKRQLEIESTTVASFTHFYFNPDIDYNNIPTDAIYIAPSERLPFFHEFNTRVIGTYLVAIPKQNTEPL